MDCFRHRKRHRSRHERDRSEQHGRSDAESEVSRTSRNSRTSRASSACRHRYLLLIDCVLYVNVYGFVISCEDPIQRS